MKKRAAFIVSSIRKGEFAAERIIRLFAAGVLLLLCSAMVTPLFAQYHEDQVDSTLESSKGDLNSGDQGKIEKFARGYYLARWTQDANLDQLHDFRHETASDTASLSSANKETCIKVLIDLFAEMAQREDLHPAVRYNAALAVGMFNEKEPSGNNMGTPFEYGAAKMAEVFNASEENPKGGKVPDYVIVAFLINLERYAAAGTTPETQKTIADIFFKILDPAFAKKHNLSSDVAVWMQKQAVDGLAVFAVPSVSGNDTVILDTFIRLIQDKSTDSAVQSAAFRGIGTMNLAGQDKLDLAQIVSAISRGAVLMNQKEISFIDEENIRTQVDSSQGAAGGRNANPMGNISFNAANGETVGIDSVLSRVKYDIEALRFAVSNGEDRGILPLLTDESQTAKKEGLENLLAQLDRVNNYLDYGVESLNEDFDPKKSKRPKQTKNSGPIYMVNVSMVRNFLTEQNDKYQDIADSLANTEEGK